jgi:hypothetical protein
MNLYEIVRDHKEKIIVKDLGFAETHKFKTEDEFIDWIKRLKSGEERSILQNRWDLGTVIHRYYDKEYGKDKLQKISDEVGYSKSTLHKACRFARNFTMEHLRTLIEGTVSLSWRDVAQNLSVDPEDFINTYKNSKTIHEFRNTVKKFKLHGEVRGRTKPKPQSFKNGINLEYRLLMRNQIEYRDWQIREKEDEIAKLGDQVKQKDEQIAQLKEMLVQSEKKEKNVGSIHQENDAKISQLLVAVG